MKVLHLYTLFVENSLKRLINSNGILNFIMPHNWIVSEFGKGLRGLILRDYHFKKFISFGAYKVFNASTYTSLIWIENKGTNSICQYYEINKDIENNIELSKEINKMMSDSYELIDMKNFNESSWLFTNKESLSIMNKINNNGLKAKEIFKGIYKGITTGDNKVFCLKRGREEGNYVIGYSDLAQCEIKIEKNIAKKMYIGNTLKKYESNYNDDYIIYPYELNNGITRIITEEKMKKEFPYTYKYLLDNKERLENRGSEKMKYQYWYSLWNYRKIENFETKKIITPDVCHNTSMILDEENYYYNDMCYALIKKDEISYSYEYLIGILNSKLFWFYLNNTGTVLSGGFYRFKTKYIENFKIILEKNESIVKKLEDLVRINIKHRNDKVEKEIDNIVYKIYNLEEKEINYIEKNY